MEFFFLHPLQSKKIHYLHVDQCARTKKINNFGTKLDDSGHSGYSAAAGGPIFSRWMFSCCTAKCTLWIFKNARGVKSQLCIDCYTIGYLRHKGISTWTVKISQPLVADKQMECDFIIIYCNSRPIRASEGQKSDFLIQQGKLWEHIENSLLTSHYDN